MQEYLIHEEHASRVELIVRIFYTIVLSIVLCLYGIIFGICHCIQWWGILILGKRFKGLNNVLIGYVEYNIQILSYANLITDERPGIAPKDLKVYIDGAPYLEYELKASRVELIVRIFYNIVLEIVWFFYSILASIVSFIQWWGILILGKRFESLNEIIIGYSKYYIQIVSYAASITDERPGISPKEINVSLDIFE
jgi:hypothetical protein